LLLLILKTFRFIKFAIYGRGQLNWLLEKVNSLKLINQLNEGIVHVNALLAPLTNAKFVSQFNEGKDQVMPLFPISNVHNHT
jgi:hypothetical protein